MKTSVSTLFALAFVSIVSAQGLPKIDPQKAGFSGERVERMRRYIQDVVDQKQFAGVNALVARHGKIVFAESFGFQDMEAKKPMRPDTIFYIFSMTKLVASTAAMVMYDDGKFLLDDPVSKYIPSFKDVKVLVSENGDQAKTEALKGPVTIHHLLTHMAGVTNARGYRAAGLTPPNAPLEEIIPKLPTVPLANQPGAAWRYSDTTLDIVNRLVEIWSGKPYDVFLQERILQPLGMKDTGYWVPAEKLSRVAKSYRLNAQLGAVEPDPNQRDAGKKPAYFSGGYGLYTTMFDYVRLCQMLLNGGELDGKRILGKPTVDFMMRNHVPLDLIPPRGPNNRPGHGYGIGGAVLMDPAKFEVPSNEGDFNWGGAAGGYWWIDRKADLIGVWLVQRPPWVPEPSKRFRIQVYQAIEN